MLPYPREGSSPRAAEVNADVQSESNVTNVLAFPLWNRWFRQWFPRRTRPTSRGDVDKKLGICFETYKSRTVISIGYMASRFKSKLCMVLSHSPRPFDQQALTVRLHFESWVLKNTRQHLFNSFKCWPLNIPFEPSPSGQGAHHFFAMQYLAVGGVGLGRGLG